MKQEKVQYCREKEVYINPQECNNAVEDCYRDCHLATQYLTDDNIPMGRIVSERTLPDNLDEIEPITYLFVAREHLGFLPKLVREALKANDMSIILIVEDKIDD